MFNDWRRWVKRDERAVFEAIFSTLPSGALATLPGGLLYTRASSAWGITGDNTGTILASASTDTPIVGRKRNVDALGLLFEEARTNLLLRANDLGTTWAPTTVTIATDFATSIDGTTIADKLTDASAVAFGSIIQTMTVPNDSLTRHLVVYIKKDLSATACAALNVTNSGGSAVNINPRLNPITGAHAASNGGSDAAYALVEDAGDWWRWILKIINNSTGNTSLTPTVYPAASDLTTYVDGASNQGSAVYGGIFMETGKFPTSPIFTAGATVTRAGGRLYHPTGSLVVRDARLGLEVNLRPLGASTEYTANMRLWTVDASNYAEIDPTNGKVTTVIAGAAGYTTASGFTFSRDDSVDYWFEGGGGILNTVVKARKNGGAVTTLGTSGSPHGTIPSNSTIDLLCNGTANQFSARVTSVRSYMSGRRAIWAA